MPWHLPKTNAQEIRLLTYRGKAIRLRFGIQSRMLLVALALGSLFVLYVAYSTARQAERDRTHVREQTRLVAAVAGSRLDDQIGDVTQALKTLAGTLDVDPQAATANDAVLRSVAAGMPAGVISVALWSLDGSNIGSSEFLPASARPRAEERAFFAAALRGSDLATEAPVRDHKGGDWVAVFAQPVLRDGRPVAVLSASSRLQTLVQSINPSDDLPEGAVVAVIDGEGRFLARSIDAERWIGKAAPLDRKLLLRRLAEGRGSSEVTGIDGVPRIFGFAKSRSVSWLVYVGVPVEAALAPARASARQSFWLGLALIGIGMLMAAWVARHIARPLRELSADARLLGEGHVEHRSPVRPGREVGLLAHPFNRLAETLQQRIAAGRRSEERLSLALEGSDQALFDWDIPGERIYYSAKACELRGEPARETEVAPDEMRALVHPDDVAGVLAALKSTVRGDTALYEAEFRVRHRNGRWIWLRSRGRVVERDAGGQALRLVGTDADISRRKAAEDQLRQRAEFDSLTGLPNRALFADRIAGAIARAERSGEALALLFVDIDHFKSVNDSHGHAVGDELLKIAAGRLGEAVRGADTVARLAGDEFTVILEGLATLEDAEAVAAKLVEALRAPMRIGDTELVISVSVGVSLLGAGEHDPVSLLRRADEALYDAKRCGRDRYATYQGELRTLA